MFDQRPDRSLRPVRSASTRQHVEQKKEEKKVTVTTRSPLAFGGYFSLSFFTERALRGASKTVMLSTSGGRRGKKPWYPSPMTGAAWCFFLFLSVPPGVRDKVCGPGIFSYLSLSLGDSVCGSGRPPLVDLFAVSPSKICSRNALAFAAVLRTQNCTESVEISGLDS